MQEIIELKINPLEGNQFFLIDKGWQWYEHGSDFWDDEGLLCQVCNHAKKMVAIGIPFAFDHLFPVTFFLNSGPTENNPVKFYDHIAEVSIVSSTGILSTEELDPENSTEIKLPSTGEYRIRVCFKGLIHEGEQHSDNRCEIYIWKARFKKRKVIKWWPKWMPMPPPKSVGGRRTIYGVSAYFNALKEKELIKVAERDYDPLPELIPYLPHGYKETAFLFIDNDGCLWEYITEPPQRFPLLSELTLQEADKLFGYKKT